MLETLVPERGPPGPTVWVWVTGRLDASGTRGESPGPLLPRFLERLAKAKIDHARVRVLAKPEFQVPDGPDRTRALLREARWFRRHSLPLAVSVSGHQLRELIAASTTGALAVP